MHVSPTVFFYDISRHLYTLAARSIKTGLKGQWPLIFRTGLCPRLARMAGVKLHKLAIRSTHATNDSDVISRDSGKLMKEENQ